MANLKTRFFTYFEILAGNDEEVIRQAQELRYQVYCLENQFENPSDSLNQRESDDFDRRSVHSIVRHNHTQLVAATVRLILPQLENIDALFPIESHCADSFKNANDDLRLLPRHTLAEISRFGISKDFKRRLGEAGTVAGVGPDVVSYCKAAEQGKRLIPHLALGLFAAIVKMSAENNITHWYAVMEPSLLRLLQRFGIFFKPIGGLIDYHGNRQPCYGKVDEILEGIWEERFDVWQLITDDGKMWPVPEQKKKAYLTMSKNDVA